MKEIQYAIYLLNMGEDYSTSAYTFLKRLNKLEIEYIEDNSDDIDKDIHNKDNNILNNKGDDKWCIHLEKKMN